MDISKTLQKRNTILMVALLLVTNLETMKITLKNYINHQGKMELCKTH